MSVGDEREREDHRLAGDVTADEAQEILDRFINSHWRNHGRYDPEAESARFSIPADPRRDDDIRMSAFIARARKLETVAEAAREYRRSEEEFHDPNAPSGAEEDATAWRRVGACRDALDAALLALQDARKGDADAG